MTDGWIAVEDAYPPVSVDIEMMDTEGRTTTGWWDGRLWRFWYWGTGMPIEFWRLRHANK